VADTDKENTLILETSEGRAVIALRPDLAPKHVARITGTGMGGSGKKLDAEFNREPHVRGTCSMARSQSPNSADSQFFICFDDAGFLDGQYTVWGKVTEGMENIDKIKRGEPVKDPDKIVSMKVAADAA
jgi:peptidylprolyl isomerase